jgi:hypothetical protein
VTVIESGDAAWPLQPSRYRLVTLIDRIDLARVARYHWWVVPRPDGRGSYAARWVGTGSSRRTLYLHRQLLDAPTGRDVVHLNDDGLDNRRANLQLASRSQSSARRHTVSPTTGFRGVYRSRNRYQAQLTVAGKRRTLGLFNNAEQAARAYDEAALAAFGAFARLNFAELASC